MITSKQNIRIPFHTSATWEFLWIKEILYIEAMENYSRLYMEDGKIYTVTLSIGQLYADIRSYGFFLCHKSYIVNLNHLIRYHKEGDIELSTGHRIPLARRRKDDFILKIKKSMEIPANPIYI